jgi:hypothetical protein
MATLQEKIAAEESGRAMLETGGIRQPDYVEYGYTCIRFFWREEKLVVVIEIDEPPDGFEPAGVDVSDAARERGGGNPADSSGDACTSPPQT